MRETSPAGATPAARSAAASVGLTPSEMYLDGGGGGGAAAVAATALFLGFAR